MRHNGLPSPIFDENGSVHFRIESRAIEEARVIAIDSTPELHQLLLGPALCFRPVVRMVQEPAHFLCSSLPLMHLLKVEWYKSTSHLQIRHRIQRPCPWRDVFFEELACKCGLNEIHLRRFFTLCYEYSLASSLSRALQRLCRAYRCLSEACRRSIGTSRAGLWV